MNMLPITTAKLVAILKALPDTSSADQAAADELHRIAIDTAPPLAFGYYAERVLTLALSPTLPANFELRTQLGYLAGITLNIYVEAFQAGAPCRRADRTYSEMLSGYITGAKMHMITLEAMKRLDLEEPTSIEVADGEMLRSEPLCLPSPIGTFTIEHVESHYSEARRFDVFFSPSGPQLAHEGASFETTDEVFRAIRRKVLNGQPMAAEDQEQSMSHVDAAFD